MPKLEIDLLTVKSAAEAMGVSVFTVFRAIKDGSLRSYDFGPHALLVDAYDVRRVKAEREAKEAKSRSREKALTTT
jgi:excisionase family DNA binding protein